MAAKLPYIYIRACARTILPRAGEACDGFAKRAEQAKPAMAWSGNINSSVAAIMVTGIYSSVAAIIKSNGQSPFTVYLFTG